MRAYGSPGRSPIIKGTSPLRQPIKAHFDGEEEENNPCDGGKEDPKRGKSRRGVYKRNCECEKNPSDNIITDPGCEDNDADGGV